MKLAVKDWKTAKLIRVLDWDENLALPMIGDFIELSDLNDFTSSTLFVIKERCFKFDKYDLNSSKTIGLFVSEVKT